MKPSRMKKKERSKSFDVLKTRLWLEYVLRTEKISRHELQKQYSAGAEPSNIILNWFKGEFSAKPNSVRKVTKKFPGSNFIYDLELFDLMEDKKLSKKRLKEIVSPYINIDDPLDHWNFPLTQNGEPNGFLTPPATRNDTESLFHRGDLYGFIGILYHVRLAEAMKDYELYVKYIADAYRAFPGLCRYKHFRKRWEELLDALISIQQRMATSTFLVMPDTAKLKEQIFAKEHITYRPFWKRDPITFRFIEPDKPYILSEFPFKKTSN